MVDRSLPAWLLNQLHGYLPADPAALLDHGLCGDTGTQPPSWLHGDLTGANVLYHHSAGDALHVSLIDFADAGHGDPLYELVVLFIRGFRCAHDPACQHVGSDFARDFALLPALVQLLAHWQQL